MTIIVFSPQNKHHRLHCILLAAGEAKRFGSPKQLAKVPESKLTFLEYSINQIPKNIPITLVLGAHSYVIRQSLADTVFSRCRLVENQNWAKGMGGSIRIGLSICESYADAVLIALVDQISLTENCYSKLIENWFANPNKINCAKYAQTQGVPAIFPKSYFQNLYDLEESQGAKKLLACSDQCRQVNLPNAEYDIDTQSALAKWQRPAT